MFHKLHNEENKIKNFVTPLLEIANAGILNKLLNVDYYISVPIIASEKSVGAFMFGMDKERKTNEDEKVFLLNLGKSLGFYLNNAWQWKLERAKNDDLTRQNSDYKKLLVIKQNFLITIDQLFSNIENEFELFQNRSKFKGSRFF